MIETDRYMEAFLSVFGQDMTVLACEKFAPNKGKCSLTPWWQVTFLHGPTNCKVVIENDRGWNHFTVEINDDDGARTFLARLENYDNTINEKNMATAARLLKEHLERGDLPFYVYESEEGKPTKIYKKRAGGSRE